MTSTRTSRIASVRPFAGPPRIAVPKGRVAQLAAGKVHVFGDDLREEAIVAPEGVCGLGVLADGSLLVVGGRETCVLAPESAVSWSFPKLTIGAELSRCWGGEKRRFWMMEGSFVGENDLPAAAGAKVKPLGEFQAPEDAIPFGDGGMAVLGAGAIAVHGRAGVRRIALPDGMFLTHLVAIGGDEAWASDGANLYRLDLSGDAAVVKLRVDAGGTVVSLDAGAGRVATLVASPRWSVVVRDAGGAVAWQAATPFQPALNEQGHLAVVLGRFDPVVAVGDETRLAVWDLSGAAADQQAT